MDRSRTGRRGSLTMDEGRILWTPPEQLLSNSRLARYQSWLSEERGLAHDGYDGLWRWSVDDIDGFWLSIWDHF